nr:unnamed protein product [Spirometra erinaceieuropaei]
MPTIRRFQPARAANAHASLHAVFGVAEGYCGSSRLLALPLRRAALLSTSRILSTRCRDSRGSSVASRALEANQRCPFSDWLVEQRQIERHIRAGLYETRRWLQRTQLAWRARSRRLLAKHFVRTSPAVKVVQLNPSYLTPDEATFFCRSHHFRRVCARYVDGYVDQSCFTTTTSLLVTESKHKRG